jgi:hypothetical protein
MRKVAKFYLASFWIRAVTMAIGAGLIAALLMRGIYPVVAAVLAAPFIDFVCDQRKSKFLLGCLVTGAAAQVLDQIQPHLGYALVIAAVVCALMASVKIGLRRIVQP